MLYYDRIDVSEGTGANKTSASKDCDVCGIFLNYNFKVQPNVWNSYHDLLMILILILLSDIAILSIKSSDYRSIVSLAKIKL